jgi:hypothetical protein
VGVKLLELPTPVLEFADSNPYPFCSVSSDVDRSEIFPFSRPVVPNGTPQCCRVG